MNLAPPRRRLAPPRFARPLLLGALVALVALAPAAAGAAPTSGEGAKPVHVLHLASSARDSYDALRLTKDLEQRFVGAADARLINSGQSLLELLDGAKCGRPFIKRTLDRNAALDESAGRDLDAPCLAKVAASLGAGGAPAERYIWGWLGREASGQSFVVAHLWQKNASEQRRVRLPYVPEQSARVAERIYLKLWHPTESGDARVAAAAAPAEGNLWVDDQDRGPFAAGGVELTLRAGEHVFELRQKAKVVARAKASVAAERSVDVRLEPVVDAPPPAPAAPAASAPASEPYTPPSTVEITRKSSALPWVAFGVGAAALAGSGLFFALRQGKESDLEGACVDGCPPSQQDTIDSSNRYGALSVVFAGVGVAAAGVGVWALLQGSGSSRTSALAPAARAAGPRPAPAFRYDVRPLAGGAGASLSATF
ncbi:MAG TPA: hypothetical protein VFS43_06335 [Polyangiaceae bacterium]|nr:hypothetical protein [Polyangiaceae bacterium]